MFSKQYNGIHFEPETHPNFVQSWWLSASDYFHQQSLILHLQNISRMNVKFGRQALSYRDVTYRTGTLLHIRYLVSISKRCSARTRNLFQKSSNWLVPWSAVIAWKGNAQWFIKTANYFKIGFWNALISQWNKWLTKTLNDSLYSTSTIRKQSDWFMHPSSRWIRIY